MSLRNKLLLLIIVPVVFSTIIAIVVASMKLRSEGEDALKEKSTAILSRMEAVRKHIAELGTIKRTAEDLIVLHPDGKLSDKEKEYVLNQVPIVASWKVGKDNAAEEHYSFRIAAQNPRNEKNRATPQEEEFIKQFKTENSTTIVHKDDATNSLWVMRPIYLSEKQGCLSCHGHPSTSPWKNGKDLLGYNMEDWKDGDARGMFVIKSDLAPLQKRIDSAIINISIWGILVGLLAVVIALTYIRKIISAIKQIINVSQKVAEGDLQSVVEINSNDELGELGQYINKMSDDLNHVLFQTRELAENLSLATKEISANSNLISEGAQNQAAQFEELASSIESSATSSDNANTISMKSSKEADSAQISMNNSMKAMIEIRDSSRKIEDAITIITDIAFQTNILALNAAVEAARAGEHGKGFAVVAAEVRKLAEKSTISANEIKDVISSSRTLIENGVNISNDASAKIKSIIDSVNVIANELETISNAAKEQSDAMDTNNQITTSNAASAEELAASASTLADQAENLNSIIAKFKLKDVS